MAVVGLSLILASVVWVVFRRPPFLETLWALIRGSPSIQQPPSTARPSPPSRGASPARDHPSTPSIITSSVDDHIPESISLPGLSTQDDGDSSPQTTPRATASSGPSHAVPSFNLVSDPSEDVKAMPPPPRLVPVPSRNPGGASGLMAPPPRPPTLNALSPNGAAARSGASLLAAPGRPLPLPNRNYDRQPGSSTLAPPPTHSSKPAKPSRKVILEPGRSPLDWARIANHPTSDLRNLPAGTPYLRVTPSMLKKQTGRKGKDAWTALNGRVYNISPYLPYHPGGEPELLRCAGRDGTKLFGEIHPWVNYETMLASSMIGLFVEENEAASSEMDDMD